MDNRTFGAKLAPWLCFIVGLAGGVAAHKLEGSFAGVTVLVWGAGLFAGTVLGGLSMRKKW